MDGIVEWIVESFGCKAAKEVINIYNCGNWKHGSNSVYSAFYRQNFWLVKKYKIQKCCGKA